jgi:Methyltransferase domain
MQPRPKLLGMTTAEEQSYFEGYAATEYSGAGEIIDLGCWLGSTTIPLAKGLLRNQDPRTLKKKIHAFDQFRWEKWMDDFVVGTEIQGRYHPGDSFLEEFQERSRPWAERITIYSGNLCNIGWIGRKVEFLLIDAMKSWELANAIISRFFHCLIPHRSYVLHQDFAHCHTPWIHLINYRFRPFFELHHVVPKSTSFVFKYRHEIPQEELRQTFAADSFSKQEIDCAFAYSISLTSNPTTQARIAAAKVMLWLQLGEKSRAKSELDHFLGKGLPLVSDMEVVKGKLRSNHPTVYSRAKNRLNKIAGVTRRRSTLITHSQILGSDLHPSFLNRSVSTALERFIAENPPFHLHKGALTNWSVQPETLRYLNSLLNPAMTTVETGCGQTTVVFAIAGTKHTCVTPDSGESDRVREYCAQLGLPASINFVIESSDKALLQGMLIPDELDLVFIDGAHAFPAPIIDWHYTARRLRIDGILALDDYKMPSVKILFDFLCAEEEWEILTIMQNTAFFKKLREVKDLVDWSGQKINSKYPGY